MVTDHRVPVLSLTVYAELAKDVVTVEKTDVVLMTTLPPLAGVAVMNCHTVVRSGTKSAANTMWSLPVRFNPPVTRI